MIKLKIIAILITVLLGAKTTKAQKADTLIATSQIDTLLKIRTEILVEITLKDGNVLRGNIVKQSEDTILFNSKLTGRITILQSNILTVKYFNEEYKGNQQVYSNLANRYFFSPSAINMKKGDGYYQNTYLYFHTFNYAITDYFTLGGGFEMFSLLLGKPIFMITPKVGFPISKKVHIGAGILYLNMLNMNSNGVSLAFGNITFGDANSNISVNIGSNIGNQGSPIFTLNGFQRLSPKFGIMTENWFLTNNENSFDIYSFGGRIIGRKNLFDFGLLTNKEITQFMLGIPFLSYTLKF